jgi:hypothetical protein
LAPTLSGCSPDPGSTLPPWRLRSAWRPSPVRQGFGPKAPDRPSWLAADVVHPHASRCTHCLPTVRRHPQPPLARFRPTHLPRCKYRTCGRRSTRGSTNATCEGSPASSALASAASKPLGSWTRWMTVTNMESPWSDGQLRIAARIDDILRVRRYSCASP